MNWFDDNYQFVWHPYTQMKTAPLPHKVVSADGVYLELSDGRKIIDAISSWWCVVHGHKHPKIVEAIKKQVDILPHTMFAGIAHPESYRLAGKLIQLLPKGFGKVYFSESGSIAVEIALKIAIQYFHNIGQKEKHKIISFENGYHGDSFGTMSLGKYPGAPNIFVKQNDNITFKIPNSSEELKEIDKYLHDHHREIAALIIEPIMQAAGGMIFHSPEILKAIYDLCKKHNILFIADEIATGFYRTGSLFAVNQADISPDIICLGKALTGGFLPMAVTCVQEEIYSAFHDDDPKKAFYHAPTYMANPLASSAAIASLEVFEEENYQQKIRNIDQFFKQEITRFKKHNIIKEVRTNGAIFAIELDDLDINKLRHKINELPVWLRPFGKIIYTAPPYISTNNELSIILENIEILLH